MTDETPAALEVVDEPTSPDPDLPARDWLRLYLGPALPKRWQQVWDESVADDVGRTRMRLTQTSVMRHPSAPGAHQVTFTATITVPSEDPAAAEAVLDDELEQLLWALDALDLSWTEAGKDNFSGRLGYRFTIQLATYRKKG